ncbi:hypothetical protein DTO166G4_5015 [Paecilomyces variotii]|nr:hypothetical protein DTO166G4_5015 [Paecilomyces variotii]KAJ9240155.1 hypothetical protein DTO166G5_2020 [Paecilomyces variotii]
MASQDLSCQTLDSTLRLHASYCRGGFDFTLLFEESILTLLPLCLFITIAPLRIIYLVRKRRKVTHGGLLPVKITAFIALGVIQTILIILWALPPAERTPASIPAAVITVAGTAVFFILSYTEHKNSVRPSIMLSIYLFLSLTFDIPRARTLWLRRTNDYNGLIATMFTVTVGIKTLALILEALEKRGVLLPEYRSYPHEATASIWNRSLFWWLNPLFRKGFSQLLGVDDLFVLDKHLASERIDSTMTAMWNNKVTRRNPHSLFFVAMNTLKWPLLAAATPRAFLIALNFCQPLLINRTLILSIQDVTSQTTNFGYGLIGAYVLVYGGIAIFMGQYQHITYRAITMLRGALVSMVYRKAIRLNAKDVDPAASLTLMSADIERIVQGWQTMHEIWANIIEVCVAIYLLDIQLGVACAVPVGVSIITLVGSMITMFLVVSRQAMWLEAIERRVSFTTSMLGSMKGIKMCGLKQVLLSSLQKLRISELTISKKFRRLLIWNMTLAYVSQIFVPIITFAVYVAISPKSGGDSILDTARIYTSLSLFALLTDPLASLVMSLVSFMGSLGSFARIQTFLSKEDYIDQRQLPSKSPESSIDISEHSIPSFGSEKISIGTKKSEMNRSIKGNLRELYNDAVTVHDGHFGWDLGEPILKSINIVIPREKFAILVGPVGCGKSTLLKAFLGEVACLEGTVQLSSENIAYCDQSPWHLNETIQKSIAAVSPFDPGWYTTVIRSCALEEDIRLLPAGDQTIIASRGVALSGGQRQRIALARAVYSRREIVILDDSFSGLDAATENQIFHSLIGKDGLLRRSRSTVILASSSAKRIPYADHIIVLDTGGRIKEQGQFHALNASGGYVSSFELPPAEWDYKPEKRSKSKLLSNASSSPIAVKTEHTIEAEANKKTGDIAVYLYYIKSIGKLGALIFAIFISAFVFCISFPSIWVKWWAISNIEEPGKHLAYYLGIYAMLGVLALGSLVIACWQIIITMVPRSGEHFHWTLLNTVLSAPTTFFSTTDIGVTLNRFSQDLQLIDMELPVVALNTFATFVLCIAQMSLIGVSSPYTAISFPVVLAVLYLCQKVYLRTSRQLRFMDLESKAPLYSHFAESLCGLLTLRAFGWQQAMERKNHQLLDRSQRPFYLLFAVQRWLTLVLDLMVAGIATLLIILVVELRPDLSAGFVGVALLNVIMFSQSIKLLVTYWTNLETHIGAVARVKVFSESVKSEDLPTENDPVPTSWPSNGSIEFKDVSAAYTPGELVLRNISFSIQTGEKIGICGRTGSGKSSLVLSLFRMIELSSGTITIDGIDISTIPRQEIRSRIIGVCQDPFLIKGTVRLNADPTGLCSETAIINALESVQLMSVIQEKGDLDTDIDELFLSHGQKQLFCLARAMLRPSTILILDEATSNIDSKTENIMQRIIRENFANHTIITVAHKLDTILDYDKIAMLEAGRLVAFDDPYTLLSTDSAFSRFYANAAAEESD